MKASERTKILKQIDMEKQVMFDHNHAPVDVIAVSKITSILEGV